MAAAGRLLAPGRRVLDLPGRRGPHPRRVLPGRLVPARRRRSWRSGFTHMVTDWVDLGAWLVTAVLVFCMVPRALRWLAPLLLLTGAFVGAVRQRRHRRPVRTVPGRRRVAVGPVAGPGDRPGCRRGWARSASASPARSSRPPGSASRSWWSAWPARPAGPAGEPRACGRPALRGADRRRLRGGQPALHRVVARRRGCRARSCPWSTRWSPTARASSPSPSTA